MIAIEIIGYVLAVAYIWIPVLLSPAIRYLARRQLTK